MCWKLYLHFFPFCFQQSKNSMAVFRSHCLQPKPENSHQIFLVCKITKSLNKKCTYLTFYFDESLCIYSLGYKKNVWVLRSSTVLPKTLLANAIWPRLRGTHSRGVAQSTSLLQGVTERGTRERRSRSQRDQERVAHNYCHSVAHSGHSVSPSVCGGPGHLVGDTLLFPPSIQCSLFQFIHKSQTPILFVYAKGTSSFSLRHCFPSQSFLPVQSYWSQPEALGCPLLHSNPVPSCSWVKDLFP